MTSLEDFNKKLATWDKTIELWNHYPNYPLVLEERVDDWTEDDWTVCANSDFPVLDWSNVEV